MPRVNQRRWLVAQLETIGHEHIEIFTRLLARLGDIFRWRINGLGGLVGLLGLGGLVGQVRLTDVVLTEVLQETRADAELNQLGGNLSAFEVARLQSLEDFSSPRRCTVPAVGAAPPRTEGGLGAPRAVDLKVVELIAGGCGATWFLLTQHDLPQNLARAPLAELDLPAAHPGPAADRYRDVLSRASALAGVAVAHIRRPRPGVVAEPDGHGGYLLTGRADWCTGWGLLDLLLVAAAAPGDRFVFGLIEATERAGLRAEAPLPLAVMGGTATIALELACCRLTADEVLLTVDAPAWQALDRARTANTRPASLGLLRRVLTELEALGHQRTAPRPWTPHSS